MYYLKIFPSLPLLTAEDTLNDFYREVQEKGHRIMFSSFKTEDGHLSAIITINDAPYRYGPKETQG